MKCDKCRRKFPDRLIAPFMSSEGNIKRACPICALEARNRIHRLPKDTPFAGTMANKMYEEAINIVRIRG